MKDIIISVEKTESGYTGYSTNFDDIFAEAPTMIELYEEIKKEVEQKKEYFKSKGDTPSYRTLANASLSFSVGIEMFFERFPMFNKTELSKYLGLNPSHLRKLKSGFLNLSEKRAKLLEEAIHELANELLGIRFKA